MSMTKEYIFTMNFDDGDYQKKWKCVVSEDKCVTYAEDEKCETFKLDTTERKPHVIQLDTMAKVFDEVLPLQVENGIPFLKMDGTWECSDTTDEDRLMANVSKYKKEAYFYALLGICMIVFQLVDWAWLKFSGEMPMFIVLGVFSISCGLINMVRLKNELGSIGRKLDWKLHRSDFEKK
jgi:hypothetical protein